MTVPKLPEHDTEVWVLPKNVLVSTPDFGVCSPKVWLYSPKDFGYPPAVGDASTKVFVLGTEASEPSPIGMKLPPLVCDNAPLNNKECPTARTAICEK